MMDHDDLVIVSLQWRLGPYGFLSTGDAASPGNYGFHDMVLGLQWVQENIHFFGGDPAKVTISGNYTFNLPTLQVGYLGHYSNLPNKHTAKITEF